MGLALYESGGLVSNTWVMYLSDGDSPQKCGVIPDTIRSVKAMEERSFGSAERSACDPSASR